MRLNKILFFVFVTYYITGTDLRGGHCGNGHPLNPTDLLENVSNIC